MQGNVNNVCYINTCINSFVYYKFIVKLTVHGLPDGKKLFLCWPFWCSELCSIDQTVTVRRGSVLDVRGPEGFCQPFCSFWMSTVLGEWGELPVIRPAVQTI